MGIVKMVAIAALVGTGIVAWSQRQAGDGLAGDLRAAGDQVVAAKDLCSERPALCATLASGAADLARQQIVRHIQGDSGTTEETTGKIGEARKRTDLPANPPLPPRRPAAMP